MTIAHIVKSISPALSNRVHLILITTVGIFQGLGMFRSVWIVGVWLVVEDFKQIVRLQGFCQKKKLFRKILPNEQGIFYNKIAVIFVGLHIRLNKLQTHKPPLKAKSSKAATPIVGPTA